MGEFLGIVKPAAVPAMSDVPGAVLRAASNFRSESDVFTTVILASLPRSALSKPRVGCVSKSVVGPSDGAALNKIDVSFMNSIIIVINPRVKRNVNSSDHCVPLSSLFI